jgi:transposase
MSSRELRRVEVLARVKSKQLKVKDAAELLGVCYRQAKRLWKRYRSGGGKALKHGNAGRRSNRAKPEKVRRQVLSLVRQKYSGAVGERFGPTLAAEHLAQEDGLAIDAETLRRWMLAEGLWSRARKRKPYLQRRERRAHFGELVQLDGSFHEWLEKRGPRACLMNMVDDATGTTLAHFSAEETTWAAAHVLRKWIERYGVPRALYTDWKNVYKRKPTAKEELEGTVPVSQFGRMCARLGIEIIAAGSPQAKGSGAQSRHAPGPAGEETAGATDSRIRESQRVSGLLLAGAQRALHATAGRSCGLSRPSAEGGATEPHFPAGTRTHGEQRLGDPASGPVVSTGGEPACARAVQGGALGSRGRQPGDRLSGQETAIPGNRHPTAETESGEDAENRTSAAGAEAGSSMEEALHGDEDVDAGADSRADANAWGALVGFALNARPTASQGYANEGTRSKVNKQRKGGHFYRANEGDISNEA